MKYKLRKNKKKKKKKKKKKIESPFSLILILENKILAEVQIRIQLS